MHPAVRSWEVGIIHNIMAEIELSQGKLFHELYPAKWARYKSLMDNAKTSKELRVFKRDLMRVRDTYNYLRKVHND